MLLPAFSNTSVSLLRIARGLGNRGSVLYLGTVSARSLGLKSGEEKLVKAEATIGLGSEQRIMSSTD